MRIFKQKNCKICGEEYLPTGSCSKYCRTCSTVAAKEAVRKGAYKHAVLSGRIKQPGVGRGGATKSGKDNPAWKNGYGLLKNKLIREIRVSRRYCEACHKDLLNASQYQWCVHHIDHNQEHNELGNLMLLCKRCHQIHHKCWKAFERATTISEESRTQESPKRPAPK